MSEYNSCVTTTALLNEGIWILDPTLEYVFIFIEVSESDYWDLLLFKRLSLFITVLCIIHVEISKKHYLRAGLGIHTTFCIGLQRETHGDKGLIEQKHPETDSSRWALTTGAVGPTPARLTLTGVWSNAATMDTFISTVGCQREKSIK